MTKHLHRVLVVIALVAGIRTAALAGPLTTDPNGLAGWQGAAAFSGVNDASILSVSVEYSVYEPGSFGSSAALGNPTDPSGGADYVYAYQAINGLVGNSGMLSLSVGLVPGAVPPASTNVGHAVPAQGTAPNLSQLLPLGVVPKGSAKWTYFSLLGTGTQSNILFFTSPFGPDFGLASMVGGNATLASALLPTPVPEPGTLLLLALALCGLVLLKARYCLATAS